MDTRADRMSRYGAALLAVMAATLLRLALDPLLDGHLPLVTYYVAVMFTAWYAGLGPAVATLVLGFVVALYAFVPPRTSLTLPDTEGLFDLGLFVFVGIMSIVMSQSYRSTHARAKLSSHEVNEQREWLRVTLASIGDAVITTDPAGLVTFMNAPAEELTGWPASQGIGQPLTTVFPIINERTRLVVENPVEKVLARGVVVGLANHTVLVARDGRERPIDDSAAPIRSPDGRIGGAVLIFRDVTEQRRAQEARQRLAAIVESSNDAIIGKTLEGLITSWNRGAEMLYGYTAAEVMGQSISILVPDDRPDDLPSIMSKLARGEQVSHYETKRRKKDGEIIDVSVTISPIQNDEGEIVGASAVARDITERHRAQAEQARLVRALQSERARFEELLRQIPVGVLVAEVPSGRIVLANNQVEKILRRPLPPPSGIDDYGSLRAFHADGRAYEPRELPLARSIVTGEVVEDEEIEFELDDGSRATLLTSSGPVHDLDGRMLAGIFTFVDITSRKRAEEALREADRRKNEFLATLSHELRNPLTPIRTAVELLRLHRMEDHDMVWARDVIERQVRHLTRLVDDLLDVARITAGKIQLRTQVTDLAGVIVRAIEAVRPLIDDQNQELAVSLPAEPIRLEADPVRLEQVVTNLLNNAVKYTRPGGRVEVALRREADHAVIRVGDSGVGIAPELLPHIFDLFTQAEQALDRAEGGLGVGLTLVRSLVELHGGRVTAHSGGPGRGSEFLVELPLGQTAPDPGDEGDALPGTTRASASARRILVVDDSDDTTRSLARLVRLWGHDVRTASDGFTALHVAEDYHPEVVLCDIGLPQMDGYQVARHLRSNDSLGRPLLVALTGYGRDEDRARSREAGFDHHLTKPVDPSVLQQILAATGPPPHSAPAPREEAE